MPGTLGLAALVTVVELEQCGMGCDAEMFPQEGCEEGMTV
jgi:hypothetical protein